MHLFDREPLFRHLETLGADGWVQTLRQKCEQAFHPEIHGMMDNWMAAWNQLPASETAEVVTTGDAVTVRPVTARPVAVHSVTAGEDCAGSTTEGGGAAVFSSDQASRLRQTLIQFHPWRKGPFCFFDQLIDTEWRSELKWNRIQPHVNLHGHTVLDVGCGNGYYGWRMLQAGATWVCGLDPFLLYVMQYEAIRKYASSSQHNYVLPVGDDVLVRDLRVFDTVFSMGVLYHRTSPVDHLQTLWHALKPGGQLVLETLVIDDHQASVLVPEGRYAKMRNVWFIPSVPMLHRWLARTGFRNSITIDVTPTTTAEQRATDWMQFESLPDFLDPADPALTIEGYPGPLRATIIARRP